MNNQQEEAVGLQSVQPGEGVALVARSSSPSTSRKVERGNRRSLHSSVHEEGKRQQNKLRHKTLRLETRRRKPFHYQDGSDGSDQGQGRLGSLWPGEFHSLAEWSPDQLEPQLSLLGERGNDTRHDNDTGHLPSCQHQQYPKDTTVFVSSSMLYDNKYGSSWKIKGIPCLSVVIHFKILIFQIFSKTGLLLAIIL